MINLLKLNVKGLQLAFFAGTAVGAAFGIGLGVGLGAGLGVLFAPSKGSELRGQLKDKMAIAADTVKEKGALLADKACDAYGNLKEQMTSDDLRKAT